MHAIYNIKKSNEMFLLRVSTKLPWKVSHISSVTFTYIQVLAYWTTADISRNILVWTFLKVASA